MNEAIEINDPACTALRKKIQQAEDQLCDLEDQKETTPDDRDSIQQLITEQRDYLAGLYESMNKMMKRKGL
jgi:small-conductance mechanosensitive channel